MFRIIFIIASSMFVFLKIIGALDVSWWWIGVPWIVFVSVVLIVVISCMAVKESKKSPRF